MGYTSDGTANAEIHWGDVAFIDSATNSQLLVAYWVKVTANPGANAGAAFSKSDFSTNGFWEYYATASDILLQANYGSPDVACTLAGAPVAGQGWLHVGFWHDIGTPTWRTYVNGTGTDQGTGSGIGAPLGNSTDNLRALCGTAHVRVAECALWATASGLTVSVANAIMAKLANPAGAERVATNVTDLPVTFYAPLATDIDDRVGPISGTNTNMVNASDHPWATSFTATAATIGFTPRDAVLTWSGETGGIVETWPTDHAVGEHTIDGDQTWTLVNGLGPGDLYVASGAAVRVGDAVNNYMMWARCESALATVNHRVQCALGPLSTEGAGGQRLGVIARYDASANTGYEFSVSNQFTTIDLVRMVAGARTTVATTGGSGAVNDVFELRVSGTNPVALEGRKNGALIVSFNDSDAARLTTGARGGIVSDVGRFFVNPSGVHSWAAADLTSASYTLTATRLAVGFSSTAVVLTWSGAGATPLRPATVWFCPDFVSTDQVSLFTSPGDWPTARALVNVYKFYPQSLTTPVTAPSADAFAWPTLGPAGAYAQLTAWGIGTAVECGVIKYWEGIGAPQNTVEFWITETLNIIARCVASGGTVTHIAMDEPYWGGAGLGLSLSESATRVRTYSDAVRAVYPEMRIGDIEPMGTTSFDAQAIIDWLNALQTAGVALNFFHVDAYSVTTAPSFWASVPPVCKAQHIPFGFLFWDTGVDTDAEWATNVNASVAAVLASGIQLDEVIFQSFATRPATGAYDIPQNLPEGTANRHTKILVDGCATLGLGVPDYQSRVHAAGRGAWRGTWRGSYAGSR